MPFSNNFAHALILALVSAAGSLALSFAAEAATYTVIAMPGASATTVTSINSVGTVAGYYQVGGITHGFTRDSLGTYTPIDVPGANATFVRSISGQRVTGEFNDNTGTHGYVRFGNNTFQTFDIPGAIQTNPVSIANGWVAGTWGDTTGHSHGFLRDPTQTLSVVDVPGAIHTFIASVNVTGEVAGSFSSPVDNKVHSFLYDTTQTITPFDPPNSNSNTASMLNNGTIVGTYFNQVRVYIRHPDTTFTTFQCPGLPATEPSGAAGAWITGYCNHPQQALHGFLRGPTGITIFDPPGSVRTTPAAVNNSGDVVGTYRDSGSLTFSFLRTP